ncbi:uncharacterized protein MYCFIDRAFT_195732 [Pseudocercospora fijiensis CIRAD86]|uniref:Uncharacterized protein n=1 Tax=Pseudocercospora fijiensis (strain CIRAD86) TaxID=383855 RepID=M3B5Y3_PSEFD|nr:uncharacterized protein MYCFIDRAFT_195732 [Pseudocercospora fijiensis CIRAD86]EME84767.1 hypothetical protein MYCFIDRAFT_195732 [Pseudocercospora fijiensis CIRAD86]
MDDDSDDTSDGSPPAPLLQDPLPKPPADTISSETRKENDLLQIREKILKESARRRAEALAQRRQAPESNGLPQNKQEIQRESERRRAENVAKRRDASKSKANPPSPLQAIPAEAAQRQKRPVPLPPLSRPLSSSSKGNNQTLSATSGQDEITILGSKTASRAPEILAETQPVPFDNAAQKAKLDALFVESDQAAKQAETDRRRELDRQDQAHLKRERQLEQERIKKAAEIKRRADDSRQKQAQVEAEEAARRAHEKQLQDALRRKHEAEAKVVAQKKAAAEKREAERRAEEQKRAKEQPPQHSVFSDEQQRARDERIRKQQERNRKMCTHADDSTIVVEDDEPHTTQLQPGSLAQQAREARQMAALDTTHADVVDPVQLRSQSSLAQSSFGDVNGSKAATSFDRPMRQIPGTKQSPVSGSTDFRRSLGEISFDDGKLLHWRDTDGKTFEDIARLYQTLTGKAQDEEFLKRRISLVKKALKLAKVSWNLTNELAKGNEDAKAQINSLVHGDSEFRQPEPRPTPLAQPQPRGRDTSHRRALADILPEDAKLVAWKAAGDDWTQIISKFEQFTGKLRSQDTLRKRCRQIEKAIESARIRGDLMERLANGDKAAQTEINTLCAEKTGTSSKVGLAPGWKANTSRLPPEIAPLDAQLVRWRDSGSEWPSIRESWNDATGLRVAVDTLKGRYEALKEVFQNTLIDDELLNDMVRGVPGAKEDVNKRIFRATNPSLPRSPVRNDSAIEQRPLSRTNRMARSDSHGAETRPSNMAAEQFRSITSILDAYADHEEIERPTTGGKTIDANFLWHAAQNMALSYEEALEEADESETESEVDPDDPEDYVYYTYTLYRKDKYYTGESDEDEVEDDEDEVEDDEDSDSQWIPVSAPFESLKKANAAVQAELLKVNPKRRPIVSLDNMNLTSGTDERGLKWAKFINDQVGEVEVAVHRTLLNYTDGKLPQSKVDWIPKHFYKVMERQTITEKSTSSVQRDPGDELFEEEYNYLTEGKPE